MEIGNLIRVYKPNSNASLVPVDLSHIDDPGPVKYLIEDFIPKGYSTSLYGDGGQGKSYIAMHISRCVLTGHRFLNKSVFGHGNVLYLDWELDTPVQRHRWGEVIKGCGLSTIPSGLFYQRMSNSLQGSIIDVYAWIAEYKPVLTILDSVGRASGNDPMDHAKSIQFLGLVETLGTTLLIDHQSKPQPDSSYSSKREFGSAYKGHYVRCSWQLERIGEDIGRIGLVFRHKKSNFGALVNDLFATLVFKTCKDGSQEVGLMTAVGDKEVSGVQFGIRSRILLYLKSEDMTIEQLGESISDVDPGSIRNEAAALKKSGLVVVAGKSGHKIILGLASRKTLHTTL